MTSSSRLNAWSVLAGDSSIDKTAFVGGALLAAKALRNAHRVYKASNAARRVASASAKAGVTGMAAWRATRAVAPKVVKQTAARGTNASVTGGKLFPEQTQNLTRTPQPTPQAPHRLGVPMAPINPGSPANYAGLDPNTRARILNMSGRRSGRQLASPRYQFGPGGTA